MDVMRMLRLAALLLCGALGGALSFQALAQGLFNDNEARRRIERLREQAAAQPPAPPAPAPASAEGEASPAETRAYQAALDQFKLGNYALAVAAMQGFLVTYPNSSLAPNAQYWIGMAHSGQRDYKS